MNLFPQGAAFEWWAHALIVPTLTETADISWLNPSIYVVVNMRLKAVNTQTYS